jgi:hypothetical protein
MRAPIPPAPKPRNYIEITFNSGKTIWSPKVETIKEIVRVFKLSPELDKQNAYVVLDNSVVFLENVDEIRWNLVEEDVHEGN